MAGSGSGCHSWPPWHVLPDVDEAISYFVAASRGEFGEAARFSALASVHQQYQLGVQYEWTSIASQSVSGQGYDTHDQPSLVDSAPVNYQCFSTEAPRDENHDRTSRPLDRATG